MSKHRSGRIKFTGNSADYLLGDATWGSSGGGAPSSHATSHENGGADEINVNGLSGVLADAQTPAAHSHAISDVTGLQTALDGIVTPKRVVGVTFDGGGSTPTVGSVGFVVVPFSGTVDQWAIVADASGSAVVDVWKASGAIPNNGNTIAGTEKPTLSSQQLNTDTSLSSWTTSVSAGDVFGFELESVATCTRITAEVRIQESA